MLCFNGIVLLFVIININIVFDRSGVDFNFSFILDILFLVFFEFRENLNVLFFF